MTDFVGDEIPVGFRAEYGVGIGNGKYGFLIKSMDENKLREMK